MSWTVTSDKAQLNLRANVSEARARIEQVALSTDQTFDGATAAALRELALGSIRPDSEDATIVAEEQDSSSYQSAAGLLNLCFR